MIRLLTLFVILTSVGCQTVPKQEKSEITPSKEVITVLVEKYDTHGFKITKSNPEPYGKKFLKLNSDGTIAQGQDVSSLFEYKITVRWSELKSDGTEKVLTSPQNTRKPNEWHTLRIGKHYDNFIPTISYLIDDEMVNLKPVNGVNLISKITPNSEQNIQAQGIIVVSWRDKTGNLINRSVPFDVSCKLDESKIVYENEITLEPAG
jgi:hypothetical protein